MKQVNPDRSGRPHEDGQEIASNPFPFLSLSRGMELAPLPREERPTAPSGESPQKPAPEAPGRSAAHNFDRSDEFGLIFDAAVSGVQARFRHLSKIDIAHPPHEWFDAALARQIAYHLMVHRYGVPKRKIVAELQRTRDAMIRAMRNVEDRLLNDEFAQAYESMGRRADRTLTQLRRKGDDDGAA